MNAMTYEDRVRAYYSTYLPQTTAQLDDPQTHFRQLADQISERVQQIEDRMQGEAIQPGESYLQRLGTLNTVHSQAEEIALQQVLYSTPPEADEDSEPSPRKGDLLVMQQEETAMKQRFEMTEGSAEATEWDRRYPHLVEEVRWTLADKDNLTDEQKRAQLAEILVRQDKARAQLDK